MNLWEVSELKVGGLGGGSSKGQTLGVKLPITPHLLCLPCALSLGILLYEPLPIMVSPPHCRALINTAH